MRSANLLISLERSKPETFFPQVSRKAFRAAATAMSTSLSEAVIWCGDYKGRGRHNDGESPAVTVHNTSSVDGLQTLSACVSGVKGDMMDHEAV